MIEQAAAFITPMKMWNPVGRRWKDLTDIECSERVNESTKVSVFGMSVEDTIQKVYDRSEVGEKQYLLATGQLDDTHSLPIAQAKAEMSLEVMITLRNKTMEAYNEILKMSM